MLILQILAALLLYDIICDMRDCAFFWGRWK
jgi:hypothetical protein